MTKHVAIRASACPHDCPSTCALEVEIREDGRVGRVRGAADNSYTAGVICAKVARYAERAHHPDRLTVPLARTGPKGSGSSRRSRGTTRWTALRRRCWRRSAAMAHSPSGPIIMPAPWATSCATVSTG